MNSGEDSAFPNKLIVEFCIARIRRFNAYVDGFVLEDHCRNLWVIEVVEELGLIPCEKIENPHGAILLIARGMQWF